MRVEVRTVNQTEAAEKAFNIRVNAALESMAQSTLAISRPKAPKKTGWLRYSGHVTVAVSKPNGYGTNSWRNAAANDYYVVYGHEHVPYARYQEYGGDGRRVIRNYTTPGTGARFLRDAAERVKERGIEAFL